MQTGRRWRALAIVGATIALTLAVAFASRPVQVGSTNASDASLTHTLGDVGIYLLMVLLAVMMVATVWALWPDSFRKWVPRRRPWWERLMPYVTLAIMLGFVFLLIENPRVLRRFRQSTLGQLLAGLQSRGRAGKLSGATTAPAGPDWTAMVIVAVIVVGTAAILIWRWQVARRRRPTPRELALDLEEVLDTGVTRLQPDGDEPLDAREAVIAAWVGFERVLARGGVPARPGEAPHEYLTRALDQLSLPLDAAALRSFTDLFEWARYSTNPVTESMREQALDTLRAVRESVHHHAVPDLHVVPA